MKNLLVAMLVFLMSSNSWAKCTAQEAASMASSAQLALSSLQKAKDLHLSAIPHTLFLDLEKSSVNKVCLVANQMVELGKKDFASIRGAFQSTLHFMKSYTSSEEFTSFEEKLHGTINKEENRVIFPQFYAQKFPYLNQLDKVCTWSASEEVVMGPLLTEIRSLADIKHKLTLNIAGIEHDLKQAYMKAINNCQ